MSTEHEIEQETQEMLQIELRTERIEQGTELTDQEDFATEISRSAMRSEFVRVRLDQ